MITITALVAGNLATMWGMYFIDKCFVEDGIATALLVLTWMMLGGFSIIIGVGVNEEV